jgi:tetratricopeptide (TPR) repeat protein
VIYRAGYLAPTRYFVSMKAYLWFHNHIVAALLSLFFACGPVFADPARLDQLFVDLAKADAQTAPAIESDIWLEWSKSGSAAMDLLLERGKQAMAIGRPDLALEHFTALADHAPQFAEGWNARATAYYMMGEFGPSVADIAVVLQREPRHFGALSGLGRIFEELDRPEQALEVYRRVIAIHPNALGINEAIQRLESQLLGKDL